jgi:hypothetical protein
MVDQPAAVIRENDGDSGESPKRFRMLRITQVEHSGGLSGWASK